MSEEITKHTQYANAKRWVPYTCKAINYAQLNYVFY